MIKEIINEVLTPEQRAQLMYAFEQNIATYIVLPDMYFIGVHVSNVPNLVTLEESGCWTYGTLLQSI